MKKFLVFSLACLVVTMTQAATTTSTWAEINDPFVGGTPNLCNRSGIFGDYNNDGYLDFFVYGASAASAATAQLWKNKGNGTWEQVELPFCVTTMYFACATWIDYNNDGYLDLICTGTSDGTFNTTLVFKNLGPSGDDPFEEDTENFLNGINCEQADYPVMLFAPLDYDNDGWTDLLMTGMSDGKWDGTHSRMTAIYRNDHGIFSTDYSVAVGSETFKQINGGIPTIGDLNGDGYVDILTTGYLDGKGNENSTFLYINNGKGGFTQSSAISFQGSENGAALIMDLNNDGNMDVVEYGRDIKNSWADFSNVFLSNGNDTFTKVANPGFPGGGGTCTMGDINNDGYMDFAYAGWPNQAYCYSNGDGTFTIQTYAETGQSLTSARCGSINLADVDNDNVLEMQQGGWSNVENTSMGGVLRNTSTTNEAPSAPTNFQVTKESDKVILTWDAGSDRETPAVALRYNIFAKTADGKIYCLTPADLTTGRQKLGGGVPYYLSRTTYTLKSTEFVEFGVQTIDGCCAASAFTTTGTPVENVEANNVQVNKYVEDGQLYILRNGVTYTVTGQKQD